MKNKVYLYMACAWLGKTAEKTEMDDSGDRCLNINQLLNWYSS